MATAPRKIQTPGEAPAADPVDTQEPDQGADAAVDLTPEEMAEQLAQLKELTQRQAEQLQAVQDAQSARHAASQAGKLEAGQRTSALTQEEALAQANQRKRSVLSRDGWVCPSEMPPPPPQAR